MNHDYTASDSSFLVYKQGKDMYEDDEMNVMT
jgi:hypothetical protein